MKMAIFSKLYTKVLTWSEHKHAPYYLSGVAFIESSVFPIPPDVMLITMGLVKPNKAWNYALIATVSSVLGGMLGYLIGACFLQLIYPYIQFFGYEHAYKTVENWVNHWGIWTILIAGLTPIPYKLFTIGAGGMHMPFWIFVLASIVGRSLRFFIVCAAMFIGGNKIEAFLRRYMDILGWGFVAICILFYFGYQLRLKM